MDKPGAITTVRDSVISGNCARTFGGALVSWAEDALFDLTNVTISGNKVEDSGYAVIHLGEKVRMSVRNSIVWRNNLSFMGDLSKSLWTNNLIEGCQENKRWSTHFVTDGGGNIDLDPQFVSSFDWREAPSLKGDFSISKGSPAEGRGDASLTSSMVDYYGRQRMMGGGLELGAIEIVEEVEVAGSKSSGWLYWVMGGCGVLIALISWWVVRRQSSRASNEIAGIQQQLEGVLERQKNFTSETSHELRSPISVILGHCELALQDSSNPEETREAVKACQRAAERIQNLTESLFELSQIEGGNIELEFSECSLREVTLEALDLVEPSANRKGVTLNEEVADITLHANGGRLWQVMVNLLNNAVRHTPSGKIVTLNAEQLNDVVELSVIDQGEGIPAKDIPHLFKKCFKGDGGETGLGLAICEAIIHVHRGELSVVSEPGVETRFVVKLSL